MRAQWKRPAFAAADCLLIATLAASPALARAPGDSGTAAIVVSAAPAGVLAPGNAGVLGATVDGLLAAGRQLSPQLRAAALEAEAAADKAEAAGTLEDPVLSENYQRYRSGGLFSMNFITVTQTFPLWGKRDLRRRAALAEVDAARGRERAAQDELDEQIKVAYARYHAFTRAVAVNREIAGLARQMRHAASIRYGQGGGDQTGVIQALTEETSAATEGARLEAERASAVARLNTLLARPASTPLAEPLLLRPLPQAEPTLEALLDRARSANPTLFVNDAEIRGARIQRRLAGKAWYPDLSVGAGPIVQTNAPMGVSATVGFTIPLQWGAKRAGEREAAARLGAARERFDAAVADIEGSLGEALARLDAARRIDELLRRQTLAQARAGFRSALASYGQGRGDLAVVLAAEHRLHDTDLELLRTETDEQTALAAIERLIGGDL